MTNGPVAVLLRLSASEKNARVIIIAVYCMRQIRVLQIIRYHLHRKASIYTADVPPRSVYSAGRW